MGNLLITMKLAVLFIYAVILMQLLAFGISVNTERRTVSYEDEELFNIAKKFNGLKASLKNISKADLSKKLKEMKASFGKLAGKKLTEAKNKFNAALKLAQEKFKGLKLKAREEREEFIKKMFDSVKGWASKNWKKMSKVDYKKNLKKCMKNSKKQGKKATKGMKDSYNSLVKGLKNNLGDASMIATLMTRVEEEAEEDEELQDFLGGLKKFAGKMKNLSKKDVMAKLNGYKEKMSKLGGDQLKKAQAQFKKGVAEAKKLFKGIGFKKFRAQREEFIKKMFDKVGGYLKAGWNKMTSVDYKKHLKGMYEKIKAAGKNASAATKKKFNELTKNFKVKFPDMKAAIDLPALFVLL